MNNVIVITSAGGKQAANLIPHLKDCQLRLVVFSSPSKERLTSTYPGAEVVQADLTRPDDCFRVTKGATSIFHIGPSFHPHETEIGYNMIDAATEHAKQNAEPIHFVYSSVLHTQLRKLLNHDCKRYVEEYLMESGLNYTILQPTTFLDNIPVAMLAKQDSPVYPALWSPDIKFSMVALKDFGEVAAKVLLEGESHYFSEYALTSTKPITFREVVDEIGSQAGKKIKVENKTLGEATTMICTRLFGDADKTNDESKDRARRMILYYDQRRLCANPGIMTWLLGRQPTGYREFIEMQIKE